MSVSVSDESSFISTRPKFRNQSNEPKPIDNFQNDKIHSSTDNSFARVNSNRQSIVKNESGLWSSGPCYQNESSMYTITLINTNQAPGPLGIHVIPTFDSISQRDMGLIIQGIEPGGRVYRDGRLQVGDRILEINRKNLIGLSFVKCQEILREAIGQSNLIQNGLLEFKIFRQTNIEGEKQKNVQKEDQGCNKENTVFKSNSINLGALNTKKIGRKISIKLVKGPEGLGFKLSARDYCNPGEFSPIYIKNILPVGAALKDGRLQRGDRLLEVNGTDMTQKTLHEVVNNLRDVKFGETVEIVVSRQILDGDANSELENFSDKTSEPSEQKLDDSLSNKDQNLNPNRQKLTFKIQVGCDSLGISVKGKTKRLEESENLVDLGIFVKAVVEAGAACRDGRIKLNDQITDINGYSLLGKSNDEAMNILKEAMQREVQPGLVEITVSRKLNKLNKRDESLSPVKNTLKLNKHTNRKSDEYAESEQFSRFNRDAPSRRSVSEKRMKSGNITNGYATYGKHLRNQSLNDCNTKRSNTLHMLNQINSTQTLGRPAKLYISGQNDYLVPQNAKSVSMESIPISQYNKKLNEYKYLTNTNNEAINQTKVDSIPSQYQVSNTDAENSTINRLNPKNRSFLTAIDKSRDKLDKTIEDSTELSESSLSSKIDMSKMEKPTIKKSSESFRHKSLIGKFQNLLKSTYSKKNQNSKNDKYNIDLKTNDKFTKKSQISMDNQNSFITESKSSEKITLKNNNSDDYLLENDTLYRQFIPNQNQNSVPIPNEIESNQRSNFANRESVYYQSIDNSTEFFLEQRKILREKQKKILEQQQKYYQENDRQPRCVARNPSFFQQFRPHVELNEKIHLSAPFNASAQCNLVSDLIREPDLTQKYFHETASTTSSVLSTSSAYTTSSVASDQQNQQFLSPQYEFQNFSHITNITQV